MNGSSTWDFPSDVLATVAAPGDGVAGKKPRTCSACADRVGPLRETIQSLLQREDETTKVGTLLDSQQPDFRGRPRFDVRLALHQDCGR